MEAQGQSVLLDWGWFLIMGLRRSHDFFRHLFAESQRILFLKWQRVKAREGSREFDALNGFAFETSNWNVGSQESRFNLHLFFANTSAIHLRWNATSHSCAAFVRVRIKYLRRYCDFLYAKFDAIFITMYEFCPNCYHHHCIMFVKYISSGPHFAW